MAQRIKWLPTLRFVTKPLRGEFMIPDDSDIPDQYRVGGSIFWR